MSPTVLYLGDTRLTEAAAYLAGVMTHAGLVYDYLPSDAPVPSDVLDRDYAAVIISDFPAANFGPAGLERLAQRVRAGLGLLMIGGWESFHGAGGLYQATPVAACLPVVISDADDRVNCAQPCLVESVSSHPIVAGLPFSDESPGVGGYNRFAAKAGAQTVLAVRRFRVRRRGGRFEFDPAVHPDPLLVVGQGEGGRVAAFASDVAPHWVGGLVDWGRSRVRASGPGAAAVEVGEFYARFFANLVRWTAGALG